MPPGVKRSIQKDKLQNRRNEKYGISNKYFR